GNHTLVSVTSGHLIAHGDLSLLSNIDAHRLIHSRRQLIAVFPGKYPGVHYNSVLSVRHLQGCISDFTGFLAEDGSQQPLLRGELRLALGGYLSYQDISCPYLRANADNPPLVQILQGIVAYTGNILGDLLRSQLGITGFRLVFLYMNGGI